MSDRINHAAEALDELEAVQLHFDEGMNGTARATVALTHATLALVEQQRIANLIALREPLDLPNGGTVWNLAIYSDVTPGALDPDISAALGLGVES